MKSFLCSPNNSSNGILEQTHAVYDSMSAQKFSELIDLILVVLNQPECE